MQQITGSLFDGIAESYYTSVPPLSEKYIKLLQKTFHIRTNDTIIDLGCGSGDLVLSLAKYSSFVQGIDESKKMIEMAKKKDINKKATWIHQSVDDFDFGEERYNLIISFESFHLFPNSNELIKRCARALKPGGSLCIGYRMFAFDIPLRKAQEEMFSMHGIPYNWGYWTCPTFTAMIAEANTSLSFPQKISIDVAVRVSTKNIKDYIYNLSDSAFLTNSEKKNIFQILWEKMSEIYPSGNCEGYDQYTIVYCKKQ